jgi:hypothetical protein
MRSLRSMCSVRHLFLSLLLQHLRLFMRKECLRLLLRMRLRRMQLQRYMHLRHQLRR